MGIKRTKKINLAADKSGTKRRTLNTGGPAAKPAKGAPFNEQDIKRRAGRYEGAGEITRGGVRGK